MTYAVIADIHGHSNLLNRALDWIKSNGIEKVIFLGDYIDRGPDSLGVMDLIIDNPHRLKYISLIGNHEDMLTMNSGVYHKPYFYCSVFKKECNGIITEKYENFFKSLHPYHVEGKNIFSHAAFDMKRGFHNQLKNHNLWYRYGNFEDFDSNEYFLTHGHTPYRNGPIKLKNRINLDCATMYGDQICIGLYDHEIIEKGPYSCIMINTSGSIIKI